MKKTIIYILSALAILWVGYEFILRPPTDHQSSEQPTIVDNMPAAAIVVLPDGGEVQGGHYTCNKWNVEYTLPASWVVSDVAIPQLQRERVQSEAAKKEDIATESHALLYIVSKSAKTTLTITSEKIKSHKNTAAELLLVDRLNLLQVGVQPLGEIAEFKQGTQLYAKADYQAGKFEIVELATICNGHEIAFLVSGTSPQEQQQALESLTSVRFGKCQ